MPLSAISRVRLKPSSSATSPSLSKEVSPYINRVWLLNSKGSMQRILREANRRLLQAGCRVGESKTIQAQGLWLRLGSALLFGKGEELVAVAYEQRAVGRDRSAVHRAPHINFGDDLLLARRRQDCNVSVLVPQIHFAVHYHRRAPYRCEHVMYPEDFARLRV